MSWTGQLGPDSKKRLMAYVCPFKPISSLRNESLRSSPSASFYFNFNFAKISMDFARYGYNLVVINEAVTFDTNIRS